MFSGLLAASAFGQGQVLFENFVASGNAFKLPTPCHALVAGLLPPK